MRVIAPGDVFEFFRVDHGPTWVGRTGDHQAVYRSVLPRHSLGDELHSRLELRRLVHLDEDDLHAERHQYVPITRIRGRSDDDLVPHIKGETAKREKRGYTERCLDKEMCR